MTAILRVVAIVAVVTLVVIVSIEIVVAIVAIVTEVAIVAGVTVLATVAGVTVEAMIAAVTVTVTVIEEVVTIAEGHMLIITCSIVLKITQPPSTTLTNMAGNVKDTSNRLLKQISLISIDFTGQKQCRQ